MAIKIKWKAADTARHLRWRTVGHMNEATIRVMVEGKKRYLRFRVEDQEVISNLELESKVLFNHLWHGIEVLQGKESVEAFLSRLDITTEGLPILDDVIYCDEEYYNSFEVAYDFDWYEKAYSTADVLTTGDVIEIIKSPTNPGYFILAFDGLHTEPRPFGDGNSTELPQDRVIYHLHRMAREIVNNHKW